MDVLTLPLSSELERANTILLAGCGGGFDIFCGLPLFYRLRKLGKRVVLANLSFSNLLDARNARQIAPHCFEVTPETTGNERYFPELHLLRWLRGQNIETSIFCFENLGVAPLCESYAALNEEIAPDAVVLIDGGTDSLMRGDETGVGTPIEDCASLMAVSVLDLDAKFLVCVGFGIDAFHGVCHAQFLENVAQVSQVGGFLGVSSLLPAMPEVAFYREACEHVFRKMPQSPSIVSSSILNAIDGHFGDFHSTSRTQSSRLFINPLMAMLWSFRADQVTSRLLYPPNLRHTTTWSQARDVISRFRETIETKPFEALPM